MKKPFAQLLEKALNRYLAFDSESARKLAALQNKVVTIELTGLQLTLQLVFSAEKITLKTEDFLPADTFIQGAPISLLHIAAAPEQRKNLFAENVTMMGDLDVGQEVIALFDELEIDWEEYLSRWVGDMPAYHAGQLARGVKNFAQKVKDAMTQNVNEYVHEEIGWFPAAEEMQDFFREVDEIRMEVDRLEARLKGFSGFPPARE